MLTRLRHRASGQEGFTLIELLVVILIIGILAAVAIPAFLSQKGKGQDANVKSDINSAQTAEESYSTNANSPGYVSADNTSATTNGAALLGVEPTLKGAITGAEGLTVNTSVTASSPLYGAPSANGAYIINATSPSGVLYSLTKYTDGTVQRTCQVPAGKNASGCNATASASAAANGTW
jgi:type IV pilus assembly protein PilA